MPPLEESRAQGRHSRGPSPSSSSQQPVALPRQDQILPPSLAALLLEAVQHVDGIDEASDVDHAPLAENVDANLPHAHSHRCERPPVGRIETPLHGVELKARLAPGFGGEAPKVREAGTHEMQVLHPGHYLRTSITRQG